MTQPSRVTSPQSYIVRIYRRDPVRPEQTAGVLLSVESAGQPRTFHSGDELLELLGLSVNRPNDGGD